MRIRPLNRSMTIACVVFIMMLSLVLSVTAYEVFTKTMFDRYEKQLASLLDYVESHIDKDDMGACARSYEESETYREFQMFFDDLIDYYEDVHYLYIMQTLGPEEPIRVREVCAANSTWEKENDPDMVLHLGDGEADWYEPEMEDRLYEIQRGDEDVYLINPSQWGVDYTLARPLVTSDGDHFACLCADISIDDLNATVYRNIYFIIAVIIISGLLFTLLLLLWMHSRVIRPLKQLQESVEDFAGKSAGRRDPDELIYHAPDLKARNEVRSLSDAVTKLSGDMRDYMKGMLTAEAETKGLQDQVFQDALTKVKNKAAYDKKIEALRWDIVNHIAEFGILMVDLNYLKVINDRYGHENGNEYITGSCRLLCEVFAHSPVYRIGGDEFVVVLQGRDYSERDRLCSELEKQFALSTKNEDADPWHRYSAAVGMAVYTQGDEPEDVFKRADEEMYEEKSFMKLQRGGRRE